MFTWRAAVLGLAVFAGAVAFAVQVEREGDVHEVHGGLALLGEKVSAGRQHGEWPSGFRVASDRESSARRDGRGANRILEVPASLAHDPWGNAYGYRIGRVTSLGADGLPGGSGLDADHAWDIAARRCSCGARR
jgi:type II secretion system (T2SS) protein G